jgi:hypothetical protein
MWSKPAQLTALGAARPLRIAYLLDPENCPHELLDAIFREAYGRWGGRRTLLVPATPDGIDERYGDWLWFYDADVIYSYVPLSDEAVAGVHEKYGPAHLKRHERLRGTSDSDPGYYRPDLPIAAVSSLSIIPTVLTRTWGFIERITNLKLLDKFWDRSESPFLEENFGFLATTFQPTVALAHPELFSCLTLITPQSLANQHLMKHSGNQYVIDEAEVLASLGQRGGPLTLANLSELLAPQLDFAESNYGWADALSLIVGDTVDDRLLFWNGHHQHHDLWLREVTGLHVSLEKAKDKKFVPLLKGIIRERGPHTSGRPDHIFLRSCSIDAATLEEVAELLRNDGYGYLGVEVVSHKDRAACIPKFGDPTQVGYRNSVTFREAFSTEKTEFRDNRVYVPNAQPWHFREALPPAGLRQGNWMIDLTIDRLNDHRRYANVRHIWQLPRRLRLERAFKLERQGDSGAIIGEIRVLRSGIPALAAEVDRKPTAITIPDDIDAFRTGLCAQHEWLPFERHRRDAPQGRERYRFAKPSDKGRYLLGILDRFATLADAFAVLMSGYWRTVLLQLGAVPAEKNAALREELLRTLRKRLGRPSGELKFATDDELQRLAREAIRFGRKVQHEDRHVRYRWLLKLWLETLHRFFAQNPGGDEDSDEFYRDKRHLDRSIQHLCQTEILFQGREWQCSHCFNRNWVTIGSISSTLKCDVCGRLEPAPVSGDWHFRGNDFVIDAYREHGVEAVIYALWQVSERARSSFYFAPSMTLWEDYPEVPDVTMIEIDALMVVDGRLYLCEAKSSAALDGDEIEKLVSAATRIRPDVVLIACMEENAAGLSRAMQTLKQRLPKEIETELLAFQASALEDDPILPH